MRIVVAVHRYNADNILFLRTIGYKLRNAFANLNDRFVFNAVQFDGFIRLYNHD